MWYPSILITIILGASTADIMQSHTADERISLPECTATADNYYVHEGRYITEWNPETIGAIFAQAYSEWRKYGTGEVRKYGSV